MTATVMTLLMHMAISPVLMAGVPEPLWQHSRPAEQALVAGAVGSGLILRFIMEIHRWERLVQTITPVNGRVIQNAYPCMVKPSNIRDVTSPNSSRNHRVTVAWSEGKRHLNSNLEPTDFESTRLQQP